MNFDLNAKSSPQRRPHRRSATNQKNAASNRNRANPKAAARRPSTASVPISVYRELSAELKATQTMLDSLHGQNQYLRKQNIHLQQEVDSIVQAAQEMQHRVGGPKPDAVEAQQANDLAKLQDLVEADTSASTGSNMVQLGAQEAALLPHPVQPELAQQPVQQRYSQQSQHPIAAMPPCVSEPPRPQEMPITPSGIEPLVVRSSEQALALRPESAQQSRSSQLAQFSLPKRQAAIETLNKIFTGREQPMPQRALDEESSEEIHMAWLVLIVFLIVVTAFGTGFLIVRPFLSNNR